MESSSVVTELRLGLSGRDEVEVKSSKKRSCSEMDDRSESVAPPTKAQLVGWPPVRSYRKNIQQRKPEADGSSSSMSMYVKVSMDGVPYLRKMDLNFCKNYFDLLKGLEKMMKCGVGIGCEYAAIYEDKDGDWMLAGDVPWDMFLTSCNRLRIIKASQTKAL